MAASESQNFGEGYRLISPISGQNSPAGVFVGYRAVASYCKNGLPSPSVMVNHTSQ